MNILIIFYLVKFGREPDMNFLFKKSMHMYFSVPTLFLNFDDWNPQQSFDFHIFNFLFFFLVKLCL
jgi:hypothetical protein